MASWSPCNRSSGPSPLQIEGSTRAFPKTKEQYVNWGDEDFMDGSRGSRSARLRQGAVLGGGGARARAFKCGGHVNVCWQSLLLQWPRTLTCTPQS